jgi:hypothetical protein
MKITPPEAGEYVDELWKKVAELTKAVNALLNMEVRVTTYNIKSGKVLPSGAGIVLVLE